MVANVKVGAKNNGKVTAAHIKAIGHGNVGGQVQAWRNWGGLYSSWFRHDTSTENVLDESLEVYINRTPTWWFRCEENENAFNHGTILDRVAEIAGVDPTEVALINVRIPEPSLKNAIEAGKAAIGWDEKWHTPGTKTLPNGKMHGIGFFWSNQFLIPWRRSPSCIYKN